MRTTTLVTCAAIGCSAFIVFACTGVDPDIVGTGGQDGGGSSSGASSGSSGASSSGSTSGDASVGTVIPAQCTAGTVRCQGAQVEVCNQEGTAYVVQKLCETAALCKTEDGGHCDAPVCPPNAMRCTGAAFEKCNDGRTAWEKKNECGSAALCRADGSGDAGGPGCDPPACAVGERRCDSGCTSLPGNSAYDCVEQCKADRTGFEHAEKCGYAQPNDTCAGSAGNAMCI